MILIFFIVLQPTPVVSDQGLLCLMAIGDESKGYFFLEAQIGWIRNACGIRMQSLFHFVRHSTGQGIEFLFGRQITSMIWSVSQKYQHWNHLKNLNSDTWMKGKKVESVTQGETEMRFTPQVKVAMFVDVVISTPSNSSAKSRLIRKRPLQ